MDKKSIHAINIRIALDKFVIIKMRLLMYSFMTNVFFTVECYLLYILFYIHLSKPQNYTFISF